MRRLLFVLMVGLGACPPAWATIQSLQYGQATLNTGAATFCPIAGSTGANTTETNRHTLQSPAGYYKNLRVKISADPANGVGVQSYDFMLMLNAGTTALTCPIPEGALTCVDLTHEVAVAAGDRKDMRITPANTPTAATGRWSVTFVSATGGETEISGGTASTNISTSATNYLSPHAAASPVTTESQVEMVFPTAGTLKNLYVQLSGSPDNGAGTQTDGFTVRRGTAAGAMADTTITCTISEGATTNNDTSHTISIAVGDRITLSSTIVAGTPTARRAWYGLTFVPDVDGEFVIPFDSDNGPSTAATNYNAVFSGSQTWNATETAVDQYVGTPFVVTGMYARAAVAPENGALTQTWDVTLRDDTGSVTGLTCQMAEATQTCAATGQSAPIANTHGLDTMCVPANTPAATTMAVSYIGYVTPRRIW